MSGRPLDRENEETQGEVDILTAIEETADNVAVALGQLDLNDAEQHQNDSSSSSSCSLELRTHYPDPRASSKRWLRPHKVDLTSMEELHMASTGMVIVKKSQSSPDLRRNLAAHSKVSVMDDPETLDEPLIELDLARQTARYIPRKKISVISTAPDSSLAANLGNPTTLPSLKLDKPSSDIGTDSEPSSTAHLDKPETVQKPRQRLYLPRPSSQCFARGQKTSDTADFSLPQSDANEKLGRTLNYPSHDWKKYSNVRPSVLDWPDREESVGNLSTLDTKDSVFYLAKPRPFPGKSSSFIDVSAFEPLPQQKESYWAKFNNKLRVLTPLRTMLTPDHASEQGPGPSKVEESAIQTKTLDGVKLESEKTPKAWARLKQVMENKNIFKLSANNDGQGSSREKSPGIFGLGRIQEQVLGKKKPDQEVPERLNYPVDTYNTILDREM